MTGDGAAAHPTVEVRLFAAVRHAADGHEHVTVAAGTVAEVIGALADRYGETMRRRLAVATVLVDGRACPHDDTVTDLAAAREVVVLPPFAGGCGGGGAAPTPLGQTSAVTPRASSTWSRNQR